MHKTGRLRLVTSKVVEREIATVPEANRRRHTVIYSLIADLPHVRPGAVRTWH